MEKQNKDLKYMKKVLQKNIKEFNLSDRIFPMGQKVLMLEDVKQAIKLLKEELIDCSLCAYCQKQILDEIDKIMGDKLI